MSQFLTDADLFDLTGLKQPAAQERYLRGKGYLFDCNARGVPRVLWSQVEARQAGVPASFAQNKAETTPNTEGLRRFVMNNRKKTVKNAK
jgi:triacylglycerol esterase/lipase EstA (alpha/beta hydrolase family)